MFFFQSQPCSFNEMFTETGQVAVCKSYLKSLRKWGSAVLILTSQGAVSSFLKLPHGYSIRFPPSAHPDDVLHACSQHRWVNSFHRLMRHAWKYRTRRNDNRPFYPKYGYLYLDCPWKIFVILLLQIVNEEDPGKSAHCFPSFIYWNIFLICSLPFPSLIKVNWLLPILPQVQTMTYSLASSRHFAHWLTMT